MARTAGVGPGAVALRLAGYVKSPSFWVTQEQFELILWMAQQNKSEIDRIRQEAEAGYGRADDYGR